MKKTYVLIGIGVAAVVAVTVVVIGAGLGGDGATATGDTTNATQPLPSGHPTVNGNGKGVATDAPSDPSVQRTITQLKAAVEADPQNTDLLLKLGDACFLGQRYREAGRVFRSVLRLKPGDSAARVRLAMVWHANGDTPRAIAALQGVIATTPQDQEAHYDLAITYFSQNDIKHAEAEWVIAARLDPASVIGRRSRSFVDLLEGRQSNSPNADGNE